VQRKVGIAVPIPAYPTFIDSPQFGRSHFGAKSFRAGLQLLSHLNLGVTYSRLGLPPLDRLSLDEKLRLAVWQRLFRPNLDVKCNQIGSLPLFHRNLDERLLLAESERHGHLNLVAMSIHRES
jgi:hypothetical protein